jgi:hypothetical protein
MISARQRAHIAADSSGVSPLIRCWFFCIVCTQKKCVQMVYVQGGTGYDADLSPAGILGDYCK